FRCISRVSPLTARGHRRTGIQRARAEHRRRCAAGRRAAAGVARGRPRPAARREGARRDEKRTGGDRQRILPRVARGKPGELRAVLEVRPQPVVALAGLVFAVTLWLIARGAGGAFLSDDFSHLAAIFNADDRGRLSAWTLARFYEPLGSGNFAYRPIA